MISTICKIALVYFGVGGGPRNTKPLLFLGSLFI
jgi:hypothetical protein